MRNLASMLHRDVIDDIDSSLTLINFFLVVTKFLSFGKLTEAKKTLWLIGDYLITLLYSLFSHPVWYTYGASNSKVFTSAKSQ